MEFTFEQKETVRICGKDYEFDTSDVDMVEAIAQNFPRILALSEEFSALHQSLSGAVSGAVEGEKAQEISARLVEKNRELLCECAEFLKGCLGTAEYEEIFQNRRPNSTEHLKLCTFLFEHMMQNREKVIAQYLDVPGDDDAAGTAAEENP